MAPRTAWRLALVLVVAAPHGLAAAAAWVRHPRARGTLLLAASVASLFLSFALFTTGPLFWPALVMEFIASVRALEEAGWNRIGDVLRPLSALGAAVLMVAALFAMFLRENPRCEGGACTSDVVTLGEATLALTLAGAGMVLAVWIARAAAAASPSV